MSNSYAAQIENLKASFVGEIAMKVAEYATHLIQRGGPDWNNASPFQYGSPNRQADGSYRENVWHEMTSHTIRLHVAFAADGIKVSAESTRHEKVIIERTFSEESTVEGIALTIYGKFERAVTGRIQYSRDEIDFG